MTIPLLTHAQVIAAAITVTREGVPRGRGSTRFCLDVDGVHFPPKYVVAVAARAVLGRELRPDEFSGGTQTNSILEGLGFRVVSCKCGALHPAEKPTKPANKISAPSKSRTTSDATILRVVMKGETPANPRSEEKILLDVFGACWPTNMHATFVLTPGGFVRGRFPRTWIGQSGWNTSAADLQPLLEEAERVVARVVTDRVVHAASGKADVISIGIDLYSDGDAHSVELVAVFDLSRGAIVRWTGKSYPTSFQEDTLVHVINLDTHLLEIAGERALVLGCHDLNMFSPRGRANQAPGGLRRARCDDMKRKIARFKPTVVLQHPHSTDTPNIWRMPWLSLAKEFPSIKTWASGLAYFSWTGKARAKVHRVQTLTKCDGDAVVDVVLRSSDYA